MMKTNSPFELITEESGTVGASPSTTGASAGTTNTPSIPTSALPLSDSTGPFQSKFAKFLCTVSYYSNYTLSTSLKKVPKRR